MQGRDCAFRKRDGEELLVGDPTLRLGRRWGQDEQLVVTRSPELNGLVSIRSRESREGERTVVRPACMKASSQVLVRAIPSEPQAWSLTPHACSRP